MTRLNVWNSCNRVFDEKLQESRREGHRARLESILNANSHSVTNLAFGCPRRGTTTNSFKALPKSKSPAAKSRQAEIERENLKMIKKIMELQRGNGLGCAAKAKTTIGKRRSRPASASTYVSQAEEPSFVPNPLTGLAPGGDLGVPTANSHPLYTRHSATMTHHFEEQNDIPLNFVPGQRSTASTRQRTQGQIHDENRKLLQRILSSKTTFSRTAWQAEERERRKLLNNISRYAHLNKRHTSQSVASTPIPSTTLQIRLTQSNIQASGSEALGRQNSPTQTLVVVDHSIRRRVDFSNVVCIGSPVMNLRNRPRPQSAFAAIRSRHDVLDQSDGKYDDVTQIMSQLGFDEDNGSDGQDIE